MQIPENAAAEDDQIPGDAAQQSAQADPSQATEEEDSSSSATTLRGLTEAMGFENVADDAEAAERILAALQQAQETERTLREQMESLRYQSMLSQQQRQVAGDATNQSPTSPSLWNPPQVDEAIVNQYITQTEDGSPTWKADTPPEIRLGYEQRQAYIRNWVNQLANSPDKALGPWMDRIKTEAVAEATKAIREQMQGAETRNFMDRMISENSDWLYQRDAQSQKPRIDPVSGNRVFSEAGAKFNDCFQEAKDAGIQDERKAWEAAMLFYTAKYGSPNRDDRKAKVNQNRLDVITKTNVTNPQVNGQDVQTPSRRTPQALQPGRRFLQNMGWA